MPSTYETLLKTISEPGADKQVHVTDIPIPDQFAGPLGVAAAEAGELRVAEEVAGSKRTALPASSDFICRETGERQRNETITAIELSRD